MSRERTLKQCQQEVDDWITTVGVRYFSELTNTAILMEEVGEVARLMARLYGDQSFKSDEGNADDLGMENGRCPVRVDLSGESERCRSRRGLRPGDGEEDQPRPRASRRQSEVEVRDANG